MKTNKRSALLFLLAGVCYLLVGVLGYDSRAITFYGNIVAGILFLLVALREYRRSPSA